MKDSIEIEKLEYEMNPSGDTVVITCCIYEGVCFKMHVTEQKVKTPYYRGQLAPIGLDKNRIQVGCINKKGEYKRKDIITEINTKDTLDEEKLKEKIFEGAKRIIKDDTKQKAIYDTLDISYDKDTMTLPYAGLKKGKHFLNNHKKYAKKDSKSKINMYNRLKKITIDFACNNKAMKFYGVQDIAYVCKEKRINKYELDMLNEFWGYLISIEYCSGNNPVNSYIEKKKNKQLNTGKQKFIKKYLEHEEVMSLCKIIGESLPGIGMGLILMLGCNLSESEALNIKFRNIIFRAEEEEAILNVFSDFKGESTHDRSRPIMPFASRILKRRYDKLMQENKLSESAVNDLFVVSKSSNYRERCSKENLQTYNNKFLKDNFFSKEDYIELGKTFKGIAKARVVCKNTYKHYLEEVCNLKKEPGMMSYLLGESLGENVTADRYISYSHDIAMDNLIKILAPCDICKEIEARKPEILDNNFKRYYFSPEYSSENDTVYIEVELEPGQTTICHTDYGQSVVVSQDNN